MFSHLISSLVSSITKMSEGKIYWHWCYWLTENARAMPNTKGKKKLWSVNKQKQRHRMKCYKLHAPSLKLSYGFFILVLLVYYTQWWGMTDNETKWITQGEYSSYGWSHVISIKVHIDVHRTRGPPQSMYLFVCSQCINNTHCSMYTHRHTGDICFELVSSL